MDQSLNKNSSLIPGGHGFCGINQALRKSGQYNWVDELW